MKHLLYSPRNILFTTLIFSLVFSSTIYAANTFDESFAIGNGIFHYNPNEGCLANPTNPSSIDGEIVIAQANIKSRDYSSALNLLTEKNPDFISLNEVFGASARDLAPAGYSGYKHRDTTRNEERSTAVVWNNRWAKTDAGLVVMVNDGPQQWDGGRSFTWVTLTNNNGGVASMISLHHMINPRYHGPDKPKRQILYKEGLLKLVEKVNELSAKGPVFVAGDFNSRYRDNDPWGPRKILKDANLVSTFDTHGSISTHVEGGTIDYIFSPSNIPSVSQSSIIPGRSISDHHFLIAKFKGETTSPGNTSNTKLVGSDNREKAFNYFVSKGLSSIQSAAIVGNMVQESGVDPQNTQQGFHPDRTKDPAKVSKNSRGQQGGWGIIQWTPSSKVLQAKIDAKAKGEIHTLATQLDIVWGHLNNSPAITTGRFNIDNYKRINTVPEAVAYFETHIEGAGNPVLENRIKYADKILEDYDGRTPASTVSTDGCSNEEDSSTPTDLGSGRGDFTDGGEVQDWAAILHNAKKSEEVFGDALVQSGWCGTITSGVWRNAGIAYGYSFAEDAYFNNPAIRHSNKKPKRGSILLYGKQGDTKAGHVVIYLGGNKILNDGHITDAADVNGWGGGAYLGWVDPNDLGWKTSKGTKESIKNAVVTNVNRASGGNYRFPPGI